jgi:hypothetical protein
MMLVNPSKRENGASRRGVYGREDMEKKSLIALDEPSLQVIVLASLSLV